MFDMLLSCTVLHCSALFYLCDFFFKILSILDIRSVSTASVDHGCCSSSPLQWDHDTGYDCQFYFDNYFDYELGTNEPIVKGRLRSCIEFWRKIDANPEVLDIIQFGYKLPFIESPPCLFSKNNKSALLHSDFVSEAISDLITKNLVIEHHEPPFVVNPLSVSIQSSGKKRLILDLRLVNKFLWKDKIKFEDWNDALKYFHKDDFMFTFDLKSGYHHVDIFPDHYKYLGFSWPMNGVVRYFTFTVLPFGLTSAPYIFTKCLRPLLKHGRGKGLFVVLYLDDGWGRESSRDDCEKAAVSVKSDLIASGLVPNKEKSVWCPTQIVDWLGLSWNSIEGSLSVTQRRVKDIKSNIQRLQEELSLVTVRKLASFAGKIVSLAPVVGKIAQLKTRFLHMEIVKRAHWDYAFVLKSKSEVIDEIFFWKSEIEALNKRMLFEYSLPQVLVYTDASNSGCGAWGAQLNFGKMEFHQNWNELEKFKSSTWRELKGVSLAIGAFASQLRGKTVKVCTDNQGVVSVVQKDSMVQELQVLSLHLFNFCRSQNIDLRIQWVPREENVRADLLSRQEDWDDWGISHEFFSFVDGRWGPHTVDRFADNFNAKLPKFNSRYWCPGSSLVDAFTVSWHGENNWLVPPIYLVGDTIKHLHVSHASGTLVVPEWPSAVFYPLLFSSNSPFRHMIVDIARFNDPERIFVQGRNMNSIFGSHRMQSAALCIRLVSR